MIDWSKYTAEEALEILQNAPPIAGVWNYSDVTKGYARNLLWDGKKGSDTTWLTVARIWMTGDKKWYASYAYDGDEYQRQAMGPFDDRFDAAAAADKFLESEGWMVSR